MPGYHWLPDVVQERLLDTEGRRDADCLRRRYPGLRSALREVRAAGAVEKAYRGYLEAWGTSRVMAASLEFGCFLEAWCRVAEPGRIADLGSGFSSWVIRQWATERARNPELVSVDDQATWLGRSRAFVEDRLGEAEGFRTWTEFRQEPGRYDLVIWDFSDVRTRAELTAWAAELVRPGGALLHDDIHKARLWRSARPVARRGDVEGFSLRCFTLDEFGRYAWLGLFAHGTDGYSERNG